VARDDIQDHRRETTMTETTIAADWFDREYDFAADAHEMTPALEADVRTILGVTWDSGDGWESVADADQYARAAQLIACSRGTCGGANERHDHMVASPYPPSGE
jgi:hypothetical protein